MSLQVWLPLDGDLHNQGLNNTTIINNGTTFEPEGKIGQCCNIPSGKYLGLDAANKNNNKYPYISIACWVYPTQGDSTERYVICCYENGGAGINLKNTKLGGQIYVGGYTNCYTPNTITLNTWQHICMTYDGVKLKVYLNGELVNSVAKTGPITYHNTCPWEIGGNPGATAFGNGNFIGKINDLRIYDHALSAKEVKEIAKGLVLHYKLDNYLLDNYFINPNLLLDTNVNGLTKVNASYNRYYESSSSGSYTCTWKTIANPPVEGINYGLQQKVTTVNGFHSVTWYQNGYVSVTSGTTYTMSCYVKVISGTDLSFKFQYGKSPYVTNTQTLKNDNDWHQYSWTFTPNTASGQAAANGTTRIYCGGLASIGEVLICGWKLEVGENATPWCETTYTPSSISNIVYDCSGFGHHGTIIGTPTTDITAPRFNSGIAMNNTNTANRIQSNTNILLPIDGITASFWVKCSKTTAQVIFAHSNFEFGILGQAGYLCLTSTAGFNLSQFITNEWNHLCVIRNNTTYKLYVNGIQAAQSGSNNYYRHDGQLLYLLNRNYNNNYAANASLCDFRLYATELSADDILDLYHTSAAIDKNGNGYAREEIEDSQLTIMKNGQFHNNELIDDDTNTIASITKTNKQLKVNTFYEY